MALVKCAGCGAGISKRAQVCPQCGEPAKKKTSRGTWLALLLIIVVGGYMMEQGGTATVGSQRQTTPREQALQMVKLDYQWSKAGFGSVMDADFTVTNPSPYAIKDITIECVHFAKSGTRIDSNKRTIYDVVPAGQARTFEQFSMGFIHSQADSSACKVVSLKV